MLLRSDGTAAACGGNDFGQCNIPAVRACHVRYVADLKLKLVLLAMFSDVPDGHLMSFFTLSGEEQCSFTVLATNKASDILARLRHTLGRADVEIDVVLPANQLLSQLVSGSPLVTLEAFMPESSRKRRRRS